MLVASSSWVRSGRVVRVRAGHERGDRIYQRPGRPWTRSPSHRAEGASPVTASPGWPSALVLDDVLDVRQGPRSWWTASSDAGMEVDESLLTGELNPWSSPGRRRVVGLVHRRRFDATARARWEGGLRGAAGRRAGSRSPVRMRSGIDRILTYVTFAIVPTAVLLFISSSGRPTIGERRSPSRAPSRWCPKGWCC
jgi:hypothetical protein